MARMKARPLSWHERHAASISASVQALASVMTTASYSDVRASRRRSMRNVLPSPGLPVTTICHPSLADLRR